MWLRPHREMVWKGASVMRQLLRRAPVTGFVCGVLIALFLVTHRPGLEGRRSVEARRWWGGVEILTWVQVDGSHIEYVNKELSGPFDVWDGEWWRVPASTLHHADLLHLLMNLMGLAVFGPWLERRWGWWRYGLFLAAAAFVASPPEYLLGQQSLGFSGVCCAVFGSLWGLRNSDPELKSRLTNEVVWWMVAGLVAMWVLTAVGMLSIANGAHFAGLAYGWLAGTIARASRWARFGFAMGHAALVVPYWFIVHPVWEGRYHWYLADLEQRRNWVAPLDELRLRRALRCDPNLTGVWRLLAQQAAADGRLLEAWEMLLQGLQHNRSAAELWQDARMLWRRLAPTEQRGAALAHLQDRFGAESAVWLAEIRRFVPPPVLIAPDRPPVPTTPVAQRPEVSPPTWEPPPDNQRWYRRPPSLGPLPWVDPADPSSAAEGRLL